MQLSDFAGFPNLVAMFLDRAAARGESPFLWAKHAGQWQSQSWAEAARKVCLLAENLRALGLSPGDRVALVSENPRYFWELAAEGLPVEFKTSMLQSLEKGEITEVDFINGSVVRWGERSGIATPVNRTLVAMVKGIENFQENFGKR